jgi:hypothetical protein
LTKLPVRELVVAREALEILGDILAGQRGKGLGTEVPQKRLDETDVVGSRLLGVRVRFRRATYRSQREG